MAQVTLAQLTQVAGAPAPAQPTAISLDDVNRVLQTNSAPKAPPLAPGLWGEYQRLQNGFNSDFEHVPRVVGNALARGSNDIGLTGLVNRVTGLPIIPTPAQEQATNAAVQARFDAQPQGGIAGGVGHIAGTALSTLPFAAGATGVIGRGLGLAATGADVISPAVGGALRGVGNFLTGGADASGVARPFVRGASGAAAGAIQGAAAAQASGNSVPEWALGGSLLGGGVGLGGGAASATGDALAPRLDDAHAALARRLINLGVNLKGGDLTQSPFAKYLYSNLSKVPFSGAGAAMADTEASWNRALTHQLGEDADRVTPEVLGAAKARIGAGYDSVTPKLTIAPSDSILSKLAGVTHEAASTLPADQATPIQKIADQFLTGFKDGQPMDGEAVHNFLKKGAPLSRMESSQDPNVRFYAGQVRSAINDELAAQAPPEARAQLQKLNSQYKVLKTLEPLVKKSPTGDISPASLMAQVAKHYPGMAYGEAGPMADLARGGQAFLKPPPSSGTAERELLFKLMGGLGGVGAGYELGKGNPSALLAIPALAAGARGIQKGMNSNAYRNALLRSAPDNYLMPPE